MAWPQQPQRYYFVSRKNKHLKHHYWLFHLRLAGLVSSLPLAAKGTARLPFQTISESFEIFSSKHPALHMTPNSELSLCVWSQSKGVYFLSGSVLTETHRKCLFFVSRYVYLSSPPSELLQFRGVTGELVLPPFWTMSCLSFGPQPQEELVIQRWDYDTEKVMRRGVRMWSWEWDGWKKRGACL